MKAILGCFFALSAAAAAARGAVRQQLPSKPHIVFALTDDLGWNTVYNNGDILSPHINTLASNGLKLTSHYVYRYCSPTRAAFLTGRSPYKLLNIRENLLPATLPQSTDPRFTMLPLRLKEAGYYSYAVGKWHQGSAYAEWTPVGRGFDRSYGFLGGGESHFDQTDGNCRYTAGGKVVTVGVTDYWEETAGSPGRHITDCDNIAVKDQQPCPQYLVLNLNQSKADNMKACAAGKFKNCAVPEQYRTGTTNDGTAGAPLMAAAAHTGAGAYQCYQCKPKRYTAYDFSAIAVEFVANHSAQHSSAPLFMYLALHNTHAPIEAPPEWVAMYNFDQAKRNTFDAMVSLVDSTVGNVTAALKAANMWENTVFIWTTDNGSPVQVGGSNAPLRGGKGSDWEGGVRTPTFITGGMLPAKMAGATLDGIVAVWDWFATFAKMAGVDPTDPNPLAPTPVDSYDMWPYFTGSVSSSPRAEIVFDHLMFGPYNKSNAYSPSACTYGGLVQVGPCDGGGAIRVGDMKLMVGTFGYAGLYGHFSPNASWTNNMTSMYRCSVDQPCLFNVSSANLGNGESDDLSAVLPDVTARLKAKFLSYNASYHPGLRPPPGETNAYCAAVLANGGYSSTWKTGTPYVPP